MLGLMENLFTITNITLFIALWGAILSTIKVLSDYRMNTRKLEVKVRNSVLSLGNIVGPPILSITAINSGRRPITLNSVGFLLPDGGKTIMIEKGCSVEFPCTLTETNPQCMVWKVQKQFAMELEKNGFEGMVKVRGYYQSATDEIFKSKPFKFFIEHALSYAE
jgi:hypothetical protein